MRVLQVCLLLSILVFSSAFLKAEESRIVFNSQDISFNEESQQLIQFVEYSKFHFIRNGKTYSSEEAADHLRLKFKRMHHWIHSTEDFINKCATHSFITKRPYMVVDQNGKTYSLSSFLHQELKNLRISQS